ncbi:preprotein translocase subunit YajC [Aquipuribacter nitratireducens]|uniref:Preprotein translocase subunit YajC n=1 Tax=Aquipuribacter nitratireducens TaxID=650104 RepID=A0ABW0GUI7_9MICO
MDPALILLLGLAVILVLQFSRFSRQRREVRDVQSSLAVGRKVLTASGMLGTVAALTDDTVTLASEDGHRTEWVRGSVVRVVPDQPAAETPGDEQPPTPTT